MCLPYFLFPDKTMLQFVFSFLLFFISFLGERAVAQNLFDAIHITKSIKKLIQEPQLTKISVWPYNLHDRCGSC